MRIGFEAIGGNCVFTSEWDSSCQKTYRANFETNHPVAGDIRQVPIGAIPPHDVLLAGFPCQPFSIAGVSKKNALGHPHGFACEAQGTLFFEVAKILAFRRPLAFVLENVKHLLRHDRGRTFQVIHEILTRDLGYEIGWRILDARAWVPQHRERIFIVGFSKSSGFDFARLELPSSETGPRLRAILHPEDGSECAEPPYTHGSTGKVAAKYTLSPQLWRYLREYAEKHRARGNGFGYGLFDREDIARTLSARYYKDGSEILIRQHGRPPRRLTPRECSRLMGFDQKKRAFRIVVSDTQAYRQFGNAVVPWVVEMIARYMFPFILSLKAEGLTQSTYDVVDFQRSRYVVPANGILRAGRGEVIVF